ncbi:hypothetical protein FA13DRAFT_1731675 [Coprinellus micaceus]|uniref:Uncharacterized protein n=1 Tax=Coprinellus micaceus TaxID=71717 RepID=A0A4Y7TG24_COPMI|nr:hypothetical protein FA13DRAFT_1731675 [Coprinellus micaceus]
MTGRRPRRQSRKKIGVNGREWAFTSYGTASFAGNSKLEMVTRSRGHCVDNVPWRDGAGPWSDAAVFSAS